MESIMEPKKIIYINQAGDGRCFVWLNTSDGSYLENRFDNYEDALAFAQGWADGITVEDGVECEVMLMAIPEALGAEEVEIEAEKIQQFATSIGTLAETFIKLTEAIRAGTLVIPDSIDIKRVYLGSTYGYNLLSRIRFLIKSPKLVLLMARFIMWMFMKLPRWLILRWRPPELRD